VVDPVGGLVGVGGRQFIIFGCVVFSKRKSDIIMGMNYELIENTIFMSLY
jgi:hypothetical protein